MKITAFVAVAALMCVSDQASQSSLRVAAKATSNFVTSVVFGEANALDLQQLVRHSTVVVRGTLVRQNTYLSADETEIYTNYHLFPSTVFGRRNPSLYDKPLVVRLLGGTLPLEGNTVTVRLQELPLPDSDIEGIFFLEQDPKTGIFTIVASQFGMFEIRGQRVLPQRSALPDHAVHDGINVHEFIARLDGILAKQRVERRK